MRENNHFRSIFPEKDGSIEIIGGLVRIYDPAEEGNPAIIHNDPMARILVNGQAIDKPREVRSADKVEITPREERIPGSVHVELAEGSMVAKIKVLPGTVIRRIVKNTPPISELVLSYEEEHEYFNDVTAAGVQAALGEKGVVFGIDLQQIEKVVSEANGTFETVARGVEMKKGRDGYVELLFVPGIKISSHNENEEELSKVDYKEKIEIPAVNEGDPIAVIHPPLPGTPGRLVTGKVIEPPSVREVMVSCKSGCEITPEGDRIYATCTGRPLVKGRKNEVLKVVPLYIHQGDVDLKSGNLRFQGELKISGDIMEGMTAESFGNMEVQGNTAGAQVISGGSIIFRHNLINSRVVAGIMVDFYSKFEPVLEEIEKTFISLIDGLKQFRATLSDRGKVIDDHKVGYLIKLIIDRKYASLPELLEKMMNLLKENRFSFPLQIEKVLLEIENLYTGNGLANIRSEADLKRIIRVLAAAGLSINELNKDLQGDIIASYIQNSTLIASGNIIVQGTGCYNTFFKAGGDIQINGVFRGGEITADGKVYIGEAGSPGLLLKQGKINLSPDSEVKFRRIYENVQLSFGNCSYKFEETRSMVKVYYSKEEDQVKIVHI